MKIDIRIADHASRDMMARAPGVIEQKLSLALSRGADEIAREAKRLAPKSMSTLTNSIRAEKVNDLHFFVAPGVDYAPWVEGGRKPGKLPGFRKGLLDWIKKEIKPANDKELERLGFAISRAIGRRGIKPQPFMQPAFDNKKDRVKFLASAAIRTAMAEIRGMP